MRKEDNEMRNTFIQTSNSRALAHSLSYLARRGASEACLMIIDGEPGLGKTTTLEYFAVQKNLIFLRAKSEWTARWFMQDLLKNIGIQPAYRFQAMFQQAIESLAIRMAQAHAAGEETAIIIDEADHICMRKEVLETIRDISDHLEIPVILVGMGRIRRAITSRFPQIASRISQYVEFKPASIKDTTDLVGGLCEVEVAEDLIGFLHRASMGKFREIKEGIAAIERFGAKQGGQKIELNMMIGQPLFNNRKTGQRIFVK